MYICKYVNVCVHKHIHICTSICTYADICAPILRSRKIIIFGLHQTHRLRCMHTYTYVYTIKHMYAFPHFYTHVRVRTHTRRIHAYT